VSISCKYCELSGRGLCHGSIICAESYRVCLSECDLQTSTMTRRRPTRANQSSRKKISAYYCEFIWAFPTKVLYTFLISSMNASCPNHVILYQFISRTTLGGSICRKVTKDSKWLHQLQRLVITSDHVSSSTRQKRIIWTKCLGTKYQHGYARHVFPKSLYCIILNDTWYKNAQNKNLP